MVGIRKGVQGLAPVVLNSLFASAHKYVIIRYNWGNEQSMKQ